MKTTLYLLAILALYGLAGTMDYQDQLAYENQLVLAGECFTDACLCVDDCLTIEGE